MMTSLFERPDNVDDLAPWLESVFASDRFGRVIVELEVLAGISDESSALKDIVDDQELSAVLQKGLASLRYEQLIQLVKSPVAMEDLHMHIHSCQTRYWTGKLQLGSGDLGFSWRERFGTEWQASAIPKTTTTIDRRFLGGLFIGATSIALVLGFLGLFDRFLNRQYQEVSVDRGAAWGWNQVGLFQSPAHDQEYLRQLGSALKEWNDRPKSTEKEFVSSLTELLVGCSELMQHDHHQLTDPSQRVALRIRCANWMSTLANLLRDESDSGKSLPIRVQEADQLIEKIIRMMETGSIKAS